MIVLLDLHDGRHFSTLVHDFHNGKPVTLAVLIQNLALFGQIKITHDGQDHQIPFHEIKRMGFSTDLTDGHDTKQSECQRTPDGKPCETCGLVK